ncbi:E3 ubiquitin-protein ligase At3g02290 [Amborella trichopoda]|uniref:RING-type E3 ubiquitin transferase n=1 Tax=Amborella trichopoda TaxID=13333 RepID=W1PUT9_AMBTC|nr:E3 ubiquitin-protein ligase At3g02290 [Amborella trichopoda]ERN11476.1 hypothetical protein AMTR_s00022p00095970 [Amborella trichopoda]|eukprot:XP_006849895.1 E3 ubiquitin-protein ligase At3g02290 [Amborella trichopoda]
MGSFCCCFGRGGCFGGGDESSYPDVSTATLGATLGGFSSLQFRESTSSTLSSQAAVNQLIPPSRDFQPMQRRRRKSQINDTNEARVAENTGMEAPLGVDSFQVLKVQGDKNSLGDGKFQHHNACKEPRKINALLLADEDEDCCPTCLEGYNADNPKIMTKCKHHYHLSCIYEWMERSNTCPLCEQVMEFNETS